ncbi:uncharacterized protein [Pseudorasbora parva]|uniref:uncharacterized protein n=1 Tax=Pseudorasbora parva TaxID=51549 RepID=UPI00351E8B01
MTLLDQIQYVLDGASGVGSDEVSVSVKEGDSVTLNTGVELAKKDRIKWYFDDTRIAQIIGDLSKICTDVQCKEGTERFRDRLKLDHQTGSLTITHTTTEDSGVYHLQIIVSSRSIDKSFSLNVIDVAVEQEKLMTKSVMEGESVTLDPAVMKTPKDLMAWYFNDVLIAEITGDQCQICADDQCKARFRDRLKLDTQTGTLTITQTKTSDSGDYKLEITSSGISFQRRRRNISITSVKSFSVSVIAVPGSGLSSAAVVGIVVGVLLVFAALTTAVIYYHHHRRHTAVPQNPNAPMETDLTEPQVLHQPIVLIWNMSLNGYMEPDKSLLCA